MKRKTYCSPLKDGEDFKIDTSALKKPTNFLRRVRGAMGLATALEDKHAAQRCITVHTGIPGKYTAQFFTMCACDLWFRRRWERSSSVGHLEYIALFVVGIPST